MRTCVASTRSNDLCGSRKPAIGGLIGLSAAGGSDRRSFEPELAGLAGDPIGYETHPFARCRIDKDQPFGEMVGKLQEIVAAARSPVDPETTPNQSARSSEDFDW
jgi:hypothetical protein